MCLSLKCQKMQSYIYKNAIYPAFFCFILDDIREGITVKLPEENPEEAWKKLLKLDETKGILKRKLTIIDLRLKDKVMVKLRKSVKKMAVSEHEV